MVFALFALPSYLVFLRRLSPTLSTRPGAVVQYRMLACVGLIFLPLVRVIYNFHPDRLVGYIFTSNVLSALVWVCWPAFAR